MAVGIVLRQNLPEFEIVTAYYNAAKFEPSKRGPLEVDRTDTFDNTFLHLVERIYEYRRSHVVVVAHGNPTYGLLMPLAKGTTVSAGYCVPRLVELVGKLAAAGGAESAITQQDIDAALADFHLKKTDAALVWRLLRKCYQIRSAADIAVVVHIRGCNIGKNLEHLNQLRKLFRSTVVSAPVCPMFFTVVGPNKVAASTYAAQHRPQGRRRVFESAGLKPLLLDVSFVNHAVRSHAAIEKSTDLVGWAKIFHKTATPSVQNNIPVAGLYADDDPKYYLAHESEYPDLLAAVRAT